MGDVLGKLFVDPDTLPEEWNGTFQLVCLGLVYAYFLSMGSNLISEGSELLLLIPSLKDIVGSVVLPVLGAVPDGAIVLFSGLGPNAAEEVAIGIGALAGSTIMLLTIPWWLAVYGGRVDIRNGTCKYTKPKLTNGMSLSHTGVQPNQSVRTGAFIMLGTCIPYLVIQIPAMFLGCEYVDGVCQASGETWWALSGMIMCFAMFIAYLFYCVRSARNNEIVEAIVEKKIGQGHIGLTAYFHSMLVQQTIFQEEGELLSDRIKKQDKVFRKVCNKFFKEIDRDNSGELDAEELRYLIYDRLHLTHITEKEFTTLMHDFDKDQNSTISMDEFTEAMRTFIMIEEAQKEKQMYNPSVKPISCRRASLIGTDMDNGGYQTGNTLSVPIARGSLGYNSMGTRQNGERQKEEPLMDEAEDEEEEDEPEVPEELQDLPKTQQLREIKKKSFIMMLQGTLLVLLFSDPMVGVFSALGSRLSIPVFFVSFVLAPLASNASELIAAYNYSLKKSRRSITISMETLQGAANMNNTFCLGIFLALVFFKGLPWKYTAETFSILLVEVLMALVSLKKTQTLGLSFVVLFLFPLSLGVVLLMEYLGFN